MPLLQTEYDFSLPKGYVDEAGTLHRDGVMRLATAADEILPLKDPRVQQNPAYLSVILLSRVVTKLGDLDAVTPKTMEGLFSTDLAFLQDFYERINGSAETTVQAVCPKCEEVFDVEVAALGGV